jgi:hypothetical protein
MGEKQASELAAPVVLLVTRRKKSFFHVWFLVSRDGWPSDWRKSLQNMVAQNIFSFEWSF